ncbi:unnamed protein product, partial [Medioppia subpectinata]
MQTFQISCQMSRFRAPKWTHNELPVIESKRITFNNRIGSEMTRIETMSVSNASVQDSGFYRCNSFSRSYHRLDVIPSQPTASTIDVIPKQHHNFEEIKEEYSTVVLKCDIISKSDTHEIFWSKNGQGIVSDDRRTIRKSGLTIRNATSIVDAGEYLCRVDSLSVRGGSQFGQIIYLRAPIRVKQLPNAQSVMKGVRRVIKCEYTGYPMGKIVWLIGNQKVTSDLLQSLGIEMKSNGDSHPDSALIIKNTTENNTDSYTCIVNNGFSEDETSVFLTVR